MKDALKPEVEVRHPPPDHGAGGARLPAPPRAPRPGAGGDPPAGERGAGAPDATRRRRRAGAAPPEPHAGFAPNVIRGNFAAHLPGVQKPANEAAAVHLPLYGRIAAGLPIEALRDPGSGVEVPAALLGGGEHYALEVAGDSMVEAGILDGDTVHHPPRRHRGERRHRGGAGGRQRGDAEAAAPARQLDRARTGQPALRDAHLRPGPGARCRAGWSGCCGSTEPGRARPACRRRRPARAVDATPVSVADRRSAVACGEDERGDRLARAGRPACTDLSSALRKLAGAPLLAWLSSELG